MKKIIFALFAVSMTILSCVGSRSQSADQNRIPSELIGTWDFVQLLDKGDHKVDTIKYIFGFEVVKGPRTSYRADGTYSREFTPEYIDRGKWYFDYEKRAIIHLLYYEKPYSFASKDLIRRGQAKKDENGDYYEIITEYVDTYTSEKLILLEKDGRKRFFKRVGK